MPKSQQIVSAVLLLAAVGVYYSRTTISSRQRTVQSAGLIRSSPRDDGFSFQILQRANNKAAVPTSVFVGTAHPHATGAYKGRSGSPPLHIHHQDDEEFTVLDGVMGYVVDGKEGILNVGEVAVLPAGVPHTFWNADPDKVLTQSVRVINKSGKPSASERFFEQWAGNAFDHGGIDNVNPLQLLLTLDAASIELVMPLPAKLLVRYVALPLARLVGFSGFYSEYVLP